MPATPYRYRAFLSYSHADRAVGERLHNEIERYAIPADLQAAGGAALPTSLRPIFRDRFDLEAGHSLTEQIRQALGESEALIVLCSPASARSRYVNEEIRQFKAAGRGTRIFPVIVAGRPGDADSECFPPALRCQVRPDGSLGEPGEEPLAADIRDAGDGWELAKLKVVAGLLSVDLDQLRRRDEVERRRRLRRTRMVAALMTVLALAAGGLALWAWSLNHDLEQANADLRAAVERETIARQDADQRYQEALKSTLKLVTIAASLSSLIDDRPFPLEMVGEKAASDDFQRYLRNVRDPHRVWFGLVQVLMRFVDTLPPELQGLRGRIEAAHLPRQWAEHAQRILVSLIAETQGHPERENDRRAYEQELATIRAAIERLRASG